MFLEQWTKYPAVEFDDVLDFAAMASLGLANAYMESGSDIDNVVPLRARRSAP